MKTRIIHTRFWQDEFVNTLNQKEKLLFIYLLTNDRVSLTGMYELPDKYIKADLELTQKELDVAKDKLTGKILFCDGWIKIVNHDKFNSYSGESIERAKDKEMALIPEKIRVGKPTLSPRVNPSVSPPNNHKSKDIIITNNPKERMVLSKNDICECHREVKKFEPPLTLPENKRKKNLATIKAMKQKILCHRFNQKNP